MNLKGQAMWKQIRGQYRQLKVYFGFQKRFVSESDALVGALRIVYLLLAAEPRPFVIGITRDPEFRYENRNFGYRSGHMVVLTASDVDSAAALETKLISHFVGKSSSLIRNQKPGGEGISRAGGLVFVYAHFRLSSGFV